MMLSRPDGRILESDRRGEKIAIILANLHETGFLRSPLLEPNPRNSRQSALFRKRAAEKSALPDSMAEGQGFEPRVRFPVQRFSRPPVSTTHASLRAILCNSLAEANFFPGNPKAGCAGTKSLVSATQIALQSCSFPHLNSGNCQPEDEWSQPTRATGVFCASFLFYWVTSDVF